MLTKKNWIVDLSFVVTVASPSVALSVELMPDFASVPAGWATDRYEPHSFANVGSVFGRDNVLGIGIDAAEGANNRPAGQQTSDYSFQGRYHAISGGPGSTLSADLYVPLSWKSESNGSVDTAMWGVMTDGTASSDFPIFSFTNIDDDPRFRVWDGDDGGWQDVASPNSFNRWFNLSIKFTGSSYLYFLNGFEIYEDTTTNGSTGFSNTIMQAYNFFDDPDHKLKDTNPVAYTAYWDNVAAVPIPATVWLFGSAMLALIGLQRRS